jgi:predicted DsbA family dithiol-disulfide isomerase
VGKKRLEKAIDLYRAAHTNDDDTFSILWYPYYLNPGAPGAPGIDKQEYLESRVGAERAQTIYARLAQAGRAEGIQFKFGGRTGNTRDSHRLIHMAKVKGGEALQTRVVEELFAAYFENEADITSRDALTEAAVKAGLEEAEVREWLESDKGGLDVDAEAHRAQRSLVTGVPHFTIQGRYRIEGAEDPQAFLEVFEKINAAETA